MTPTPPTGLPATPAAARGALTLPAPNNAPAQPHHPPTAGWAPQANSAASAAAAPSSAPPGWAPPPGAATGYPPPAPPPGYAPPTGSPGYRPPAYPPPGYRPPTYPLPARTYAPPPAAPARAVSATTAYPWRSIARPIHREPFPASGGGIMIGAAAGTVWMLLFGIVASGARSYAWWSISAGIGAWLAAAALARSGDRGVAAGVAMAAGIGVGTAMLVVMLRWIGGTWLLW